jgi:hypothetical protein
MDTFFASNPGFKSRIAHHVDFPDYTGDELLEIAQKMVAEMNYQFDPAALTALRDYIALRVSQPHFANARSIRNALDRARMRQANRLFDTALNHNAQVTSQTLTTIVEADIRASRVFQGGEDSPSENEKL